jgi:hypothetical protein
MSNLKATLWPLEDPIYNKIKEMGFQEYLASRPNKSKVMQTNDHVVRCMDERCPGGIHAGGSMLLMNHEQILQYLKTSKPKGLTSHDDCGAAGILYRKLNQLPENASLDQLTLSDFAKAKTQKIAKTYQIPYLGHLKLEEMSKPVEIHTARCLYYVGVEDFDPSLEQSLPKGFIVNRRFMQSDYALEEVKIALKIVQGSHGFGELFEANSPFYIFIIGNLDEQMSVQNLLAEIRSLETPDWVKIDTYQN